MINTLYSENIRNDIRRNQISPEWFVSSGVIQLRHTRKQDTMERSIQVIKLRGVRHSDQIHLVELSDEGLRVMHPRFTP